MKYGMILYHGTENLGDDILTYAAKRYLPHVDYYIDRESLNTFVPEEKEKVNVIFNGFFLHHKLNWPPSPYMNPFFVGFHYTVSDPFGAPEYMYLNAFSSYFKKYEPIGARDYATRNALINNDVDSYFSGCLTLTLNSFDDVEKNNKVFLTDVSSEVEQYVREQLPNDTIECVTHRYRDEEIIESCQMDIESAYKLRESKVVNMLKKYQGAKLVITSRLHCALPCLALGTPVILINKGNRDYDIRMGSYLSLLYNCTEEELVTGQFEYDLQNPKSNKPDYLELREKLIESSTDFITRCEKNEQVSDEELPEVEEFKKYFVKPTKILQENIYQQLHQRRGVEIQLCNELNLLNQKYKNTCLLAKSYGENVLALTEENQKLKDELYLVYDKLKKSVEKV